MIEPLARLGYASKALVYAIVGGLATAAVMNRGGRVTDTSGALRVILRQPYGHVLLIVLAIGLCGFLHRAVVTAIMSNVLARPARPVPRTDSFDAAGGRCGS